MKQLFLLLSMCVLYTPCVQAQANLTPAQAARLDSLEQKVLDRVEQTQGEGAAVGADGPWIIEKNLLTHTFQCIQQNMLAQTNAILVCLEPLQIYYETAYPKQKLSHLTRTLRQMPFITQDNQPVYVASFIEKKVPPILTDESQRHELAQALSDKTPQQVQLFLDKMLLWRTHLLQHPAKKN